MSAIERCPDCGAELAVPEGVCPNCLFARARADLPSASDETPTIRVPSAQLPRLATAPLASVQYFGDYELLEEIARGGMGVVYKARQTSLNRIVAVKMILAGGLASDAEVKRFHTEAEAAANLQHPNIVAIHEIGQHEGQNYFSMDYVEGRNLAELTQGAPLAPLVAARFVKIIAEAVHHAHQRGTLHRDLKPQNVLIDSLDQPRVTDFGLAKRVGGDGELTRTGAVMGSPAYMPPEQAAGRQDLVGPQSDVYSIGAILYHLLTGHAPFVAENAMVTLRKVLEEEAVPPSKRNPRTPKDLETICLKCLEKRPERRYHSARELAEELGRFQDETPILARPASRLRKVWNWTARNPWALTGASSIVVLGLIGLAYGLWEHNKYLLWRQTHGALRPAQSAAWAIATASGLFGFYAAPLSFADFVDRKRQGLLIRPRLYWVYGSIGAVAIVGSIGTMLEVVHARAWGLAGLGGPPAPLFLALCIPGAWFGSLLLWHLARHYQDAAFARERVNENVLFPPKAKQPVLVEYVAQRQRRNRYCWAALSILILTVVAVRGQMARQTFFSLAAAAAAMPVLSGWYRKTASANRHLILFAGFYFCLAAIIPVFVLESFREEAGGPGTPAASRLSYLVALGFGLVAGFVVAWFDQWKCAEVMETADWPWVRAVKTRALSKASFHAWIWLCVAVVSLASTMVIGPWLFSAAPEASRSALGFLVCLSAVLPYQASCWLRAGGVERRTRANSVAVSVAAVSALLLANPIEHGLRAFGVGFGAGLLALGFVVLRSRAVTTAPPAC